MTTPSSSRCPLYQELRGARCAAIEGEVSPSLHERERYCCTERFALCPTFEVHRRTGARLTETEYLSLWMPPAPMPRGYPGGAGVEGKAAAAAATHAAVDTRSVMAEAERCEPEMAPRAGPSRHVGA